MKRDTVRIIGSLLWFVYKALLYGNLWLSLIINLIAQYRRGWGKVEETD